ncbi:MAG TPA: DUF1996 domain-containing protein [Actinoplanes sp.]|nr:DUF1996 domain-containing protein [Actinoplanes sp.]
MARKIMALGVLAATGAAVVVFVSSGGRGSASAETSLQDFLPIERVAADVVVPKPQRNASRGVFTVDCGTNGNGKFSPDNPVAQPGIKNGAEHVHDFVGNLAITADTSDDALAASGTTCRNGDRSAYFWPVLRIDPAVRAQAADTALAGTAPTVSCPQVRERLQAVPGSAAPEVNRQLATLDKLTADANARLAAGKGQIDADFNNSVLTPLRAQRAVAVKRISVVMARHGRKPANLVSTVDCEVSYDGLHAGHVAAGTTASAVTPTVSCPSVKDNLPAVPDQALDEVNANLAELDKQIAAANEQLVTAADEGGASFIDNAILGPLKDKRTAVLDRIAIAIGRIGTRPTGLDALASCALAGPSGAGTPAPAPSASSAAALPDPSGPNLELPGNTGGIVQPASVLIEYRGNATSKVTPMPKFLRALTGDAKPTSRGPANARATWTCSGFADRLSDKYPICPATSKVMRVQDFPGCWDGKNIDSTNHRSHLAFADKTSGACPAGFVAIPQLRISISYDIPRDVQDRGQFALDSFPEENHNPFSDHNDFINVNSDRQMTKIAACLNAGRHCS